MTCKDCVRNCPNKGKNIRCRNYKAGVIAPAPTKNVIEYLKKQGFSFETITSIECVEYDNAYDKSIIAREHLVAYKLLSNGKTQYYARPNSPRYGKIGYTIPLDLADLAKQGYNTEPFYATNVKVIQEFLREEN